MLIKQVFFAFSFEDQVYRSNISVAVKAVHSYSAILSIASYLVENFPQIVPLDAVKEMQEMKKKISKQYNPILQFWHNYLINCVLNGYAIRKQSTFYILIPLKWLKPQQIITKESQFTIVSIQQNQDKTCHIFNLIPITSNKKIGVLNAHPILEQQKYLPIINNPASFIGILYNNDNWSVFDLPKGNLPSLDQLLQLDIVIITGSRDSVTDQSKYISQTLRRLMIAYDKSKLKIIGVCYGHQLLAHHFGSQIVNKDIVGRLQHIKFSKDLIDENKFLQGLQDKDNLIFTQHHCDFVETVPSNFNLLAQSQSCKVEALLSKDGRIFTSQFHSEYPFDYLSNFNQLLRKTQGIDFRFKVSQSKQKIDRNHECSILFYQCMRRYIDM